MDYYAGYDDDFRDSVKDPLEVDALRAFLLSPCRGPNDRSCGFSLYPGKPYLLYKKVQLENSNVALIEIALQNSALTTSDRENRDVKNVSQQNAKSEAVRQNFIKSVATADVIVYSGHSRFGGGPDFYPEHFLPNGADDPAYYLTTKKGLNDMVGSLSNRQESPFLIFMGSCDSKKHFQEALFKNAKGPRHAILGTRAVTAPEYRYEFLHFLNGFLNQSCEKSDRFGNFELLHKAN